MVSSEEAVSNALIIDLALFKHVYIQDKSLHCTYGVIMELRNVVSNSIFQYYLHYKLSSSLREIPIENL